MKILSSSPIVRAALLLGLALALQACQPSEEASCDQLLGEGKYNDVLAQCDNPADRASAYLGMAGVDFEKLVDPDIPVGNIVALLGLTPANITEKRLLLERAAREVRNPGSGAQGSALLLSAFFGLAVIVAEFLDNGAQGAATALDDVVDASEIVEATGITTGTVTDLQFASDSNNYLQMVLAGVPYTVLCIDLTVAACDGDPLSILTVFDDGDGSGRLDTGALPIPPADQDTLRTQLPNANPVSLVVLMTSLVLPLNIDPTKTGALENFLGAGDASVNFAFGVTGYLDLITAATAALVAAVGGTGGIPGLDDQINAVKTQIDNGGKCL
ncbi:MAG: hypothetical protein O7C61_06140, partial [SAR324 cluster bacterium]|nr:hypothetical protein [SAR324 cluster bacterium]